MYPNPQDVLPLPPRPDIEQYRKRAKDLAAACRSGQDEMRSWASRWVHTLLQLQGEGSPKPASRDAENIAGEIAQFAGERLKQSDCALSQAQFVIARAHGFASWTRLAQHIENLTADSAISAFEKAADAIIDGDLATLERLLEQDSALVRAQSTREHRATLLHYVAANGVENYRQRTPANIVTIARRLLDAGADVHAEADVYGGGSTTLGLVVTSALPRQAKVQNALADLLLEHGARIEVGIVRSCLMNGCPEAAAHMAARGASLDLVDSAGLGRLDLIAPQFAPPHTVSPADAAEAMLLASWYDQREVIRFLLDAGVAAGTSTPHDGRTALHIAAFTGKPALVQLLLERGAPVNATDLNYGTPPLAWALHAWLVEKRKTADAFRAVVRLLLEAGSEVQARWLDLNGLREEPELWEALSKRAREKDG